MPDQEKTSKSTFAGKMMAMLLPPAVFTAVARDHVKVAELIGLLVGAVAWYFYPPRGRLRSFLIVFFVAMTLGIVNILLR